MELHFDTDTPNHTVVLTHAVPLRDASGRSRGAIAAAVDITERKRYERRLMAADDRLRENQKLINLVQQAGQVGFLEYDFEGDRLTCSPGQQRLLGEPQRLDSLGDFLDCLVADHRGGIERLLNMMIERRQSGETLDYEVVRGNGQTRWLSTRVLLDYAADGAPVRLLGVTVDVNEHKASRETGPA